MADGDCHIQEIRDEAQLYMALAKSKMLLACFTAKWCRPCVAFDPKLQRLSRLFPQVAFVKLDVDNLADVATEYGVRVLPTFMLFKGGFRVGSVSVTMEDKIEELLRRHGAFPQVVG